MNNTDNRQISIPVAIIIAGVMIAGAVYLGGSRGSATADSLTGKNNQGVNAPVAGDVKAVTDKDHILGNKDAKVIVVEYSDLECPFCKTFHNTMHQVMDTYKGKSIAWVYRHFPIAQLHSKAPKEAEASECAADQGGNTAWWAFADKVFATTGSNNTLDPAELPKIAASIGLDVAKFNNCLSSGVHTAEIAADVAAASAAGAQGTPYSVILTKDGQKIVINGAEPFDTVKAKIDSVI